MAALFTQLACFFIAIRRRRAKLFFKFGIEITDDRAPVDAFVFNVIQLLFHFGSETDVHNIFKAFDQHIHHLIGNGVGEHILCFLADVFLVELCNDGGVGGRSADPLFFHHLNQRCIRITQGGLGEFLLRLHALFKHLIPFGKVGQELGRIHAFFVVFVGKILIDRRETREQQHLAACLEYVAAVFNFHLRAVVFCFRHLRSQETLVDKLVKLIVSCVQQALCALGRHQKVDGTNGFVSVLRPLLGRIEVRLGRNVVVAVALTDICKRLFLGILGNTDGVRSHIGDERNVVAARRLHTFVQMLRQGHGVRRRKAELGRSVLLQGTRRKRSRRVRFCHRLFYLGYDVIACGKRRKHRFRFFLGSRLILFRSLLFKQRLEGGVLPFHVDKLDGQVPKFFGLEGFNFTFSFYNQAKGNRLHSACRKAASAVRTFVNHFVIEQRGKLIAYKSIQHTACLLRIHQPIVDFTGARKRRFDCRFRYFVKLDTVFGVFIQSQNRL